LRQALRVNLVEQVVQAHATLARLKHRPLGLTVAVGLWLGLVIGYLSGEAVYVWRNPQYPFFHGFSTGPTGVLEVVLGTFVGLVTCGLFIGGQVLLRQHRLARARQALRDGLQELTAEFPDDVRAWGGPAVLRNPATARAVLRLLKPEPPVPAP
jgi:hypothetical protein